MTANKKLIAGIFAIAAAACLLVISQRPGSVPVQALSKAEQELHIAKLEAYTKSYDEDSSYYRVRKKWEAAKVPVPKRQYTIPLAQLDGGKVYDQLQSGGYGSDVIYLEPKDPFSFELNVDDEGLYEIWLDYCVLPQSAINPELAIEINGTKQYNEMDELRLAVDWKVEEGRKVDRFGDELAQRSEILSIWKKSGLTDPNFFFTDPLKFYMKKGNNQVRITLREGAVLIGKIGLSNSASSALPYETYRKNSKGSSQAGSGSRIITLEAERVSVKSRQSIRAKYMRDPQVTPYDYKHRVLNVLDGYSFGESGDSVSYSFDVAESGFYHLTFKYSQDTNNGMPTHRRIEIDGEVPFQEMECYNFDYSGGWTNETLGDSASVPYEIYLEKGSHTLTLSVDNSNMRDIYHELLATTKAIDSIAQDINQLTGGLVDKKRKWRIEKYIPDIKVYLSGIASKLAEQKNALIVQTRNEDLPAIGELEAAEQLVREFIADPEKLPHYRSKFSEGEHSAYGKIKSVLPMLIYNPMHLDKIYVHQGSDLPAPKAGFITGAVESSKAFMYSFFNKRYSRSDDTDSDAVEVWVNQSRLYVDVMQRMIDEKFTPATGIKINLSVLPDENKIVLSNAAGSTPDAAMGIGYGKPFELALRGIVENLEPYDGFHELTKEYNPGSFISVIYDKGIYGFPETQDVKLLFYRKDILKFLGEDPPQTWDDVIGLVPMLQRYDMNFYTPLGSNNAFKGFDNTTPFIYQFGGRLYDETGTKAVVNTDGAYKAFEFMTDLFTVYNVPITTSEFYQSFRNGTTPVGISDANTYIQLKYAAPELAGQWGILPIPGVANQDGTIERWDPTYGSSSVIFKNSAKKDKAWAFIKWWASAETQSVFSYNIKAALGDKFLYMTANLEGFKKSAWPSDSKDAILEQWKWIQASGRVPGDYVLEREISNAWNKVVFGKENPRVAIENAVKTTNRELERKLKEFGYVKDGKPVKPYVVPTIENVENWVKTDGN
ncbi:extracellular solute-binding protein [Paenibacillus sp. GCM10027626]|uniref:extracellular solute-binding protein n=1 Tax=Paenibacillus sp. GCM10027626 TaxID=3273411 RepID=UPI003624C503